MQELTISMDMLLGLGIGIIIPALLWAFKMFSMVKQTRDMHLSPDDHDFGSGTTNSLLLEHFKCEEKYHRQYVDAMVTLRHVVRELSHYMKWMVKENTGQDPPPYIRKNGD